MKREKLIKIFLSSIVTIFVLAAMLILHIYLVTKPKAPDGRTRVMARIDIRKPISNFQSKQITSWLYQQMGVDHVMVNQQASIAIFTFSPLIANANMIASKFRAELNYPESTRYVPSEKELQRGCPVTANSFSYKVVKFIKGIL